MSDINMSPTEDEDAAEPVPLASNDESDDNAIAEPLESDEDDDGSSSIEELDNDVPNGDDDDTADHTVATSSPHLDQQSPDRNIDGLPDSADSPVRSPSPQSGIDEQSEAAESPLAEEESDDNVNIDTEVSSEFFNSPVWEDRGTPTLDDDVNQATTETDHNAPASPDSPVVEDTSNPASPAEKDNEFPDEELDSKAAEGPESGNIGSREDESLDNHSEPSVDQTEAMKNDDDLGEEAESDTADVHEDEPEDLAEGDVDNVRTECDVEKSDAESGIERSDVETGGENDIEASLDDGHAAEEHTEETDTQLPLSHATKDQGDAEIASPDLEHDSEMEAEPPRKSPSPSVGDSISAPLSPEQDVFDDEKDGDINSPDLRDETAEAASPVGSPNPEPDAEMADDDESESQRITSKKRSAPIAQSDDEDFGDLDGEDDFEGFEDTETMEHTSAGAILAAEKDGKPDENVDDLVADIFGESDEEEEFEGFGEADIEHAVEDAAKEHEVAAAITTIDEDEIPSDLDEDDEDLGPAPRVSDFASDFDLMMERKKMERTRSRRKRRHDVDIINDMDDRVAELKIEMLEAAEEDRNLNRQNQAATKKLALLPRILREMHKLDLQAAFIEGGILTALADWLAPLPDKSLPNLQLREGILKILKEYPPLHSDQLKDSGIGKAVMYLYKHPKETKQNRHIAGRLIQTWARPIFNLSANYRSLTKEERQERELKQLPKRRRESLDGQSSNRDIDSALAGENRSLRPGDVGWIPRARVPMPSFKDYVIRPEPAVRDTAKGTSMFTGFQSGSRSKPVITRYDKHARAFAERKKRTRSHHAIPISIEGRKM